MRFAVALILIISLQSTSACKAKKLSSDTSAFQAPLVIYKTRADYSKYIPVTLSNNRSEIVAYPSPQDIFLNGKLALPTLLANGYLLDNRGISTHTAFLNITYEEYAKMTDVLPISELYKLIIDKEPITEMYNLGSRGSFKNEVKEINQIIKSGALKNYKQIK